ncbi:MAG: hypothetical protein H7062_09725 [Candidatus Saccharimonas sp.]|nr:hypothetical protein [Planctomycetaceae bacterium]
MRKPSTSPALLAMSLFLSASLLGCETIESTSLGRMLPFGKKTNLSPQETEQRQKFMNERDPDAFRWLLTHRIHNEMTVEQVAHVLGESGERRFDDREYKTNGGFYHMTDVGYQWGPDRKGHTVVLYFRDGKLINFDPAELQ